MICKKFVLLKLIELMLKHLQEISNKIKLLKNIHILFHRNKAATESISETLQTEFKLASPGQAFSDDFKALCSLHMTTRNTIFMAKCALIVPW